VLDGIDGIVLGAETLRGKFPLETVATVRNICRQAEKVFDHHYHFEHLMDAAISAGDADGLGARRGGCCCGRAGRAGGRAGGLLRGGGGVGRRSRGLISGPGRARAPGSRRSG
jgi:hypothetical protein